MITSALPQLEFRLAENTAQDSDRFCQLSNSLYARPVNDAYYSWQFFQTPFPSATALAVTPDGELIGSYTLHVQPTLPEKVNVAWVLDIMVSPKYQRKGVMRQLMGFATEQTRQFNPVALCVMANEKANQACVDGLGWHRINTINTSFLKCNNAEESQRTLSYQAIDNFEDCAELLNQQQYAMNVEKHSLLANERSVDYLNWRFVENPRYRYARFVAEKSSGVFGYIVLKVFRDPVSEKSFGDIVDLFWLENDVKALRDILLFAVSWFKQAGVSESTMWLQTNTVLDQVGKDLGFALRQQPRYFCCNVLDACYNWLKDPNRWFITMADSEVY
jgi:GNAT superfamily N-acetyltransferase